MQEFEKLGAFYLGREYDLEKEKTTGSLVLYDSKDLVTHAVCVGMTGSGKTGLCIGVLEEAAIDGIPSIIIDPKGDLANLLLTFPELRGEDLQPWVNEEEARKQGISVQEFAARQSERWRKGLEEWGQNPERIQRLKNAADFNVYTPGSTAGLPVSILRSFLRPQESDPEFWREKVTATATSLLALLGMEGNPMQSREHILLSTIFDSAWKSDRDLDLAGLIQLIQIPPVSRIGVMDLDSFFPSKDRFEFSILLNNLLASPGFQAWTQGEPLNIGNFLHTKEGKPHVSIFSIAHLNDSERMFFVSLLLSEILAWVRTQSGTSSLRALLYMDEIFGYLPPVANPPSKLPLLTLLKQARAFGLGILLATQNPVDLDYKALANMGTWFIGRLQTERDKARLLDGLEGASSTSGMSFDRQRIEEILGSLQSRIFYMNNVHEEEPVIFQTRSTLSYLAGPLTRNQIKVLMDPRRSGEQVAAATASKAAQPKAVVSGKERPVLPPEIPQFFLPLRPGTDPSEVTYQPFLIGIGKIYYVDPKVGIATERNASYLLPLSKEDFSVDWRNAEPAALGESDLDRFPAEDASFADLPGQAAKAKNFDAWRKLFADWLFRTQVLQLFRSRNLRQLSRPEETERDFRIRLQDASRVRRDQEIERIRQRYASKITSLHERLRTRQQAVDRETEQAKQQKLQTAISFGTTVLGALFGRKKLSTSTLGRATAAARGVGRTMKESQDIERAQDSVEGVQKQLADLEAQVKLETDEFLGRLDSQTEAFEQVQLKPKKSNVTVRLVALVWRHM